jgi:hypothetical protein
MAGHGRKECDTIVLEVLAAGGSVASAAQRAGVSERTIRRRLQDAAFRNQVAALRSQFLTDAIGRLATIATAAADELYRLVKQAKNDQTRLGAARAILTLALAGHEHLLLAAQVEELQRQVNELALGVKTCGETNNGRADKVP